MKLLVGLGNPGPKYEMTRHNAGFLILDEIASDSGISWSGSKFQSHYAKGNVLGEPCVLLKPQTFMNLSGRAVTQALQFFKLDPASLIVLHDDIDVPFGKVKTRTGGGHGGNNGIRSILGELGTGDFNRIKLGVGRPTKPEDGEVTNWVLGRFTDAEIEILQKSMLQDAFVRLESIFKQSR